MKQQYELPLYEIHLNAFEIGIFAGSLSKLKIPFRKELAEEIDLVFRRKKGEGKP